MSPQSDPGAQLPDYVERVLAVVRAVPAGHVVTYGDIAGWLGEGGARQVGQVLSRYGSDVPWWRVVRAGGLAPQGHTLRALAHYRTEDTPVRDPVPDGYRVDLRRARWQPDPATLAELSPRTGLQTSPTAPGQGAGSGRGGLHHVEIWVRDFAAAQSSWSWLLEALGWRCGDHWGHGAAWELGAVYLVIESGPDVLSGRHKRTRPGVNHLAFHAGDRAQVDDLVAQAPAHGWELLFAERHPYAGGPQHYAAYLQDRQGFEVELVAGPH